MFHKSFSAAKKARKPDRIHRKYLPPPPRNHDEVLKHEFSAGFKAAEKREFNILFGKKLCSEINQQELENMIKIGELEADRNALPLMWVYSYKFDADGFLVSFKARLVARGDLQSTTEETYAATLTARVFRAAMAIAAVYDLRIR